MNRPIEVQDLLDLLDEQEPFEALRPHLSEAILVETAIKWLTIAIDKAEGNPRLVNRPEEIAKKLLGLAGRFAWLK